MENDAPTIPRATVAAAFDLPADTDALPPGDLPVARFAARFLCALDAEDDTDAWTVDLFHHLVTADPALAAQALLVCLDQAPDHAESIGQGPLTDLLTRAGADAIGTLDAATCSALPRAMAAVESEDIKNPFLLARITAAGSANPTAR